MFVHGVSQHVSRRLQRNLYHAKKTCYAILIFPPVIISNSVHLSITFGVAGNLINIENRMDGKYGCIPTWMNFGAILATTVLNQLHILNVEWGKWGKESNNSTFSSSKLPTWSIPGWLLSLSYSGFLTSQLNLAIFYKYQVCSIILTP